MLPTLDADTVRSLALALSVLLASARLLGHLAKRLGWPSVVGELAAGVALGPTILGALSPSISQAIVPDGGTVRIVLDGLAWLGVVLLLASTGAAVDVRLAMSRLRPGLWLPVMALFVPLVVGGGVGWVLPARFLGTADRPVAAAFIAVILAISALPTIARTLTDLDLLQRRVGHLTLATAALIDLAGWILLALLTAGLGDLSSAGRSILLVVVFFAFALTAGRRLVDLVLRMSLRMTDTVAGPLTTALVVVLTTVWASTLVGLDPTVGALLAGLLLADSGALRPRAQSALEDITTAVLGPLFFALAGAALNLGDLSDPRDLAWTAILFVAAVGSKMAGAMMGARLAGMSRPLGLAVGVGLSARGGLGVVVASVAVGAGVLSQTGFAAAVVVAVATSLLAPPILGAVIGRVPDSIEDQVELRRRKLLETSGVVSAQRVLLLTRGGAHSRVAARVLDLSLNPSASVTVFVVHDPDAPGPLPETADPSTGAPDTAQAATAVGEAVTALLGHRRAQVKVVAASDVAGAIHAEVRKGYDLIVAGMSGGLQAPAAVGAVLNRVMLECPVPVLLVRSRTDSEGLTFRRLVTGATGTQPSRTAQDVAFSLARNGGAGVDLVHVIGRSDRILHESWFRNADRQPAPRHLLSEAAERAALFGVDVTTHTRVGSGAAEQLLQVAQDLQADTLVVSATALPLDSRLFLGHGIEYLLEHAAQNLIIVTFPASGDVADDRTERLGAASAT